VRLELTAVFLRKDPEGGYVAYVEELPGANTQGETLDEARLNLREAVELVIDANRVLARGCRRDSRAVAPHGVIRAGREAHRPDSPSRGEWLSSIAGRWNHSVYVNPVARQASSVPRHREIRDFLARKICRDLQVQSPDVVREERASGSQRRRQKSAAESCGRTGGMRMTSVRRNLGKRLIASMREAVKIEAGTLRPARRHRRTVADTSVNPPPEYSSARVRALRERLQLSQPVFARALNVSVATVRGWEQGARVPDGPSRRLLELVDREPRVVLRAIQKSRERSLGAPPA